MQKVSIKMKGGRCRKTSRFRQKVLNSSASWWKGPSPRTLYSYPKKICICVLCSYLKSVLTKRGADFLRSGYPLAKPFGLADIYVEGSIFPGGHSLCEVEKTGRTTLDVRVPDRGRVAHPPERADLERRRPTPRSVETRPTLDHNWYIYWWVCVCVLRVCIYKSACAWMKACEGVCASFRLQLEWGLFQSIYTDICKRGLQCKACKTRPAMQGLLCWLPSFYSIQLACCDSELVSMTTSFNSSKYVNSSSSGSSKSRSSSNAERRRRRAVSSFVLRRWARWLMMVESSRPSWYACFSPLCSLLDIQQQQPFHLNCDLILASEIAIYRPRTCRPALVLSTTRTTLQKKLMAKICRSRSNGPGLWQDHRSFLKLMVRGR